MMRTIKSKREHTNTFVGNSYFIIVFNDEITGHLYKK